MGIQFSEGGPQFPSELINAMLSGEAVFLCGAGVSTPQLPGFRPLVDQVYERLKMEPKRAESDAIREGRLEEALGALARRLTDPDLMYRTVARLLRVDD